MASRIVTQFSLHHGYVVLGKESETEVSISPRVVDYYFLILVLSLHFRP